MSQSLTVIRPVPPPPSSRVGLPPLLKWAGGKTWLVPTLERIYASHRARLFCEPFAGGLSIALGLLPGRAQVSDLNAHLTHFYERVRSGLNFSIPMKNDEELYYQHRNTFNELTASGQKQTKKAAELFFFLNRTGFNGLCRFNGSGGYNVPFGRYSTINYKRNMTPYSAAMADWEFAAASFETVTFPDGSFVYADPPYDGTFDKYCGRSFTWGQQVELAHKLASHSGPVVASNAATPEIVALYDGLGFEIEFLEAPRRISCNGDRTPVTEILATRRV